MADDDRSERTRDLAAFANASAQPNQPPSGHALVRPTTGLAERVIGAQPVSVYRDEARILQKLATLAAAAGTDWFYRFPVRKKDGGQDWIEGPSIKLANDIARIFGNNINEVRELDVGDAWIFYARFTDIETGFSMERAYRQRKSQGSIKSRDAERQLDIAYQIGQSKAIRNCIVNSLQIYADYAFEHARNSLVDKIGKDLPNWKQRTIEGIQRVPVELNRVERVIGRSAKDWLAPHVAQVIACLKSIADGMATAEEVFPPLDTPKEAVQDAEVVKETAPQQGHREPNASASPPAETDTPAGTAAQRNANATDTAPGAGAQQDRVVDSKQELNLNQPQETPDVAYRKGLADHRAGMSRKALPPQWRGDDAQSQAMARAWASGWDAAARNKQGEPST